MDSLGRDPILLHATSSHPRTGDNRRILYLSVQDPHTPINGTGRRLHAFVRFLSERFDVDLVYMQGSGAPPMPDVARRFSGGLPTVRTKTTAPFSPQGYFLFSPALFHAATELAKANDYDLIVADYGMCGLYGLLLARRFNVPLLYSSHNVEYRSSLDKSKSDVRRLPLAAYLFAVERLVAKRADIVIATTDSDAARYRMWRPQKPVLAIPQGIDERVFNASYTHSTNSVKRILFCGNFAVPFNRDVIRVVERQILPQLVQQWPNVVFEFIGAGATTQVRDPRMHFLGFMDDYPAHLKAADVVISPMLRGQGFPTKIIEALACGKPTVATEIGARGIPSTFQNLHVCRVEHFAEVIRRLLSENRPVNTDDVEEIQSRYSWDALLQPLPPALDGIWSRKSGNFGSDRLSIRHARLS